MKKNVIGYLGIVLLLFAGAASAGKSKPWRANNHTGKTVKVFWTATNCAGVKPSCRPNHDLNGDVSYVCKTETLQAGEESQYKFPGGTYNRKKKACIIEPGHRTGVSNTEDRTTNGIWRSEGNDAVHWGPDG